MAFSVEKWKGVTQGIGLPAHHVELAQNGGEGRSLRVSAGATVAVWRGDAVALVFLSAAAGCHLRFGCRNCTLSVNDSYWWVNTAM